MSQLPDDVRQRYGLPPGVPVCRAEAGADGRVRLATGAFHTVPVPSSLAWAAWDRPVVVAGGTVRLTVQGAFVGRGSPVRAVLKDARNRTLGRAEGAMHRDRATLAFAVDRGASDRDPGGVLAAADVELPELGLQAVSAPLRVFPFAELDRAEWGQAEAREGDPVVLSCRVTGSRAGVERLEGRLATVQVVRGEDDGGAGGLDTLFEPVVALRAPVRGGRVEATWRVGFDAEGRGRLATQADLDAAAERTGAEAESYARPRWRFRVDLAGLEAESGDLAYRDWVEFAFTGADEAPYADLGVTVEHPDGARTEATTGGDGVVRIEPAPPGPYRVVEVREPDPETASPSGEPA